jgi:hypothetical protein
VEANDRVVAVTPSAIEAKVANAYMHPTQPSGRNEHVSQPYIIHDNKIVSEGTELDMYETRPVGRMYWMRRLFAGRPSTSLGVLNKYAECDFEAVGRDACNTASVGPRELPTLNGY